MVELSQESCNDVTGPVTDNIIISLAITDCNITKACQETECQARNADNKQVEYRDND